MVSVDDIIEITDSAYEKNGIKLKGRRYWVRKVKPNGGVNAAPIVPENTVYQQEATGVNWDTLGLSDKGRPRSLPAGVFQVIGTMQGDNDGKAIQNTATLSSSGSTATPAATTSTPSSPLATSNLFGGVPTDVSDEEVMDEVVSDEVVDDEDSDAPVSEEVQEILDVADVEPTEKEEAAPSTPSTPKGAGLKKIDSMMVSDGLCFTTDLLSPFEQAREIDACKIPTITDESLSFPELVLDKKTGMGFRVRVCFSAPINYTNPQAYSSQADLDKAMSSNSAKSYMILREYEIGAKVKDVCGSKAKEIKPIQWHTNGKPFNEEAEVVSLTLQWAPDSTANCPSSASPVSIVATLQTSDGNTFSLLHQIQEVVFTAPVTATPSASGGFNLFGGHSTATGAEGIATQESDITGSSVGSALANSTIEIEPEGEQEVNSFPSTEKNAAPSMNDVRAILAMSYDHDHPAFSDFEKEYVVDWNQQPSVMSADATDYVQVVLEVQEGEGIVTNRFPGKWQNSAMLKNLPEMWSNYPRRVVLIFPQADSEFLLCPTDAITPEKGSDDMLDFSEFPRETWIDEVQEVKYYEANGVIKDIQLIQRYESVEIKGIGQKETKEVTLTKTMKVGEMYEFASKEPASSLRVPLKGRLVKVEVVKDASRESIFQALMSERRSLRVIEDYEVFFATEKDERGKTRFVIVIKNESGKPNSGQIIRVDLGKSKQQQEGE